MQVLILNRAVIHSYRMNIDPLRATLIGPSDEQGNSCHRQPTLKCHRKLHLGMARASSIDEHRRGLRYPSWSNADPHHVSDTARIECASQLHTSPSPFVHSAQRIPMCTCWRSRRCGEVDLHNFFRTQSGGIVFSLLNTSSSDDVCQHVPPSAPDHSATPHCVEYSLSGALIAHTVRRHAYLAVTCLPHRS